MRVRWKLAQSVGKKWTIGQETTTHGQDGRGLPQAQFTTGRNITDRRHPHFAVKPSSDFKNLARRPTDRFARTQQREIPMKSLISRAIYHPFIALSVFYLVDVMHHVDYSVGGALLVLATKTVSRVLSLFNKG
ncbi:hypothetical protein F0160_02730 [Paraburkholderia sp. JPY303]|uniref:hypothetical protein n=1 Tax=Paraburkholderia atlantica TaxID=2654982 RepID=UPI0003735E04|nr:hypothetical protein [Paraburkholderia atlantica]NUY29433.1 hypothetical protein [Paraburkholderia atlantica]